MPSESTITLNILSYLRSVGAYAIKHHGGPHSRRGTPDVLACLRGRMVVVEVKVPGKTPTEAQRIELVRWADAGALAMWATSTAQVREALEGAGLVDTLVV